jgi:hypothetical protein
VNCGLRPAGHDLFEPSADIRTHDSLHHQITTRQGHPRACHAIFTHRISIFILVPVFNIARVSGERSDVK